jgi:hypothetical protein
MRLLSRKTAMSKPLIDPAYVRQLEARIADLEAENCKLRNQIKGGVEMDTAPSGDKSEPTRRAVKPTPRKKIVW